MDYDSEQEVRERVSKLEHYHSEKMTALALLNERHDRTAEHLDKLEGMLLVVRDRVMAWRDCPDPGACISLSQKVTVMQGELDSIKTDRAIVVGGWKLIGVIGGGIMAIGVGAYSLWLFIEKLVHSRNP